MTTRIRLLLACFILFSMPANAQFYTIGKQKATEKGLKDFKQKESAESSEREHQDCVLFAPNINYLFEQYKSVSFPLKKIRITSPFGMRFHPIDKVRKLHNGIDLSAKNEEVYAVLDGVVEAVGYNNISGNYIILKHAAGLTVSYCHLREYNKHRGEEIRAGDIVGISGNTGKSTNFHLHFVVRKDGKYIDPTLLIKFIEDYRRDAIRSYIQRIEG